MGDAAGRQQKLFECDLRAPDAQLQLTEGLDGRQRRSAIDAAAADGAVWGAPAPHSRCVKVQPNVHLDVAELISMDVEMILMLGCTFRATFFFLNFSGTHTLLEQLPGCSVCAMGAKPLCLPSHIRAVHVPNDGDHP